MRRPERYICWDLDETLGSFRDYSSMRMKKGIRPLLESLSEKGIGQVVTTAASREHAEYVLGHFSIGEHFGHIFDFSMICDGSYNKFYAPVARALGMDAAEAPERLLVVGNLIRDSPSDLDLVFVYLPQADEAGPIYRARGLMELLPDGRFSESFEGLCSLPGAKISNNVFSGSESGGAFIGRAKFPKPQPPGGTKVLTDVLLDEDYKEKIKEAA